MAQAIMVGRGVGVAEQGALAGRVHAAVTMETAARRGVGCLAGKGRGAVAKGAPKVAKGEVVAEEMVEPEAMVEVCRASGMVLTAALVGMGVADKVMETVVRVEVRVVGNTARAAEEVGQLGGGAGAVRAAWETEEAKAALAAGSPVPGALERQAPIS